MSPKRIPSDGNAFVYFLISGDEVVYVGQTKDLDYRLSVHASSGKVFDRSFHVEVSEAHVDIVESCYIHNMKPALNGNLNGSETKNIPEKCAPLTMSRISQMLCEMVDNEKDKK